MPTIKMCWFYEQANLSYFTFKNGIRIERPKTSRDINACVSLCVRDQTNMAERKKTVQKGGRY